MNRELLSFYGDIHADYLHAYSEAGTEYLLQELVLKADARVLEIGFGTGATLVKLRARNPLIDLHGVEHSEKMLNKCKERLRFCGVSNTIALHKSTSDTIFPFKDASFDTIYAESVLNIQEGPHLKNMLVEVYRILKPGGTFVLNETLWLPEISASEINTINTTCKQNFGIIQAGAEYATSQEWMVVLHNCGFLNVQVNPIEAHHLQMPITGVERLSKLYTFFGKLKRYLPNNLRAGLHYKHAMKNLFSDKKYMDGFLFKATK